MELPTYTNIWRIEKRLYKLYDFRLPMPLPVGQVAAFLAIAIPYMLILTMAGMPFSHTWVWLYVLPPAVLAWLVTRPVLESKRLPELVVSQLRYLVEPRTWCRMAPLAEKDQILVTARVWRSSGVAISQPAAAITDHAVAPERAVAPQWAVASHLVDLSESAAAPVRAGVPIPAEAPMPAEAPVLAEVPVPAEVPVAADVTSDMPHPAGRPLWPTRPAVGSSAGCPLPSQAASESAEQGLPQTVESPAPVETATPAPAASVRMRATPGGPSRPERQPTVTVRTSGGPPKDLPAVESALRHRGENWHERVAVVPGGHRPGKPGQLQRDQARARFPLPGPARIVVLGCTAGAGQTTMTLLTGQLLATLRAEAVAVLDIGSGPGSLTEQARQIPRLLPSHRDAESRAPEPGRDRGLQVVTADPPQDEPADAGQLIDAVVAHYRITIADPAAAYMPRAVPVADQLVLVAPASADAARSLAMTLEWLEAHGHVGLARRSVAVLNGVSTLTAGYVDEAVGVAAGRCRAMVRVPWDHAIAGRGPLGPATVHAITALAGVLMTGLADVASSRGVQVGSERR